MITFFSPERPDYWDIDDFGMGLSCLVATTADKIDPKRKVGSCVLSEDGQVLSFGYNHMPDKDDSYSQQREIIYSQTNLINYKQ